MSIISKLSGGDNNTKSLKDIKEVYLDHFGTGALLQYIMKFSCKILITSEVDSNLVQSEVSIHSHL